MGTGYFESFYITGMIILYVTLPLILFGILVAYCMLLDNRYINNIIEMVINIPVIFPPIGIGFLLVICFGRKGYLGSLFNIDIVFSFTGICIAAFLTGIPFIARAVMAGGNNSIRDLCEASYTLGKGRFSTFMLVVIPLLRNSMMQGLILAIGRIVGEVGITLLVGGNIAGKTTTVSLDIYNAVLDGENNRAMLLAGILFVVSLILFYVLRLISSRISTVN